MNETFEKLETVLEKAKERCIDEISNGSEEKFMESVETLSTELAKVESEISKTIAEWQKEIQRKFFTVSPCALENAVEIGLEYYGEYPEEANIYEDMVERVEDAVLDNDVKVIAFDGDYRLSNRDVDWVFDSVRKAIKDANEAIDHILEIDNMEQAIRTSVDEVMVRLNEMMGRMTEMRRTIESDLCVLESILTPDDAKALASAYI